MSNDAKLKKVRRPWLRVALGTAKWLGLPLLCLFALFGGLVVGYVYLGDQPPEDVWKPGTWKHVFDLVFSL
jgi:hypothetical protein